MPEEINSDIRDNSRCVPSGPIRSDDRDSRKFLAHSLSTLKLLRLAKLRFFCFVAQPSYYRKPRVKYFCYIA